MKTLGITLIIATSICGDKYQNICKKTVPSVQDPHCGLGTKCHFNGLNKFVIAFESCRRKELGIQGFLKVVRGLCPKGDKPPCPGLSKAPKKTQIWG
ncbi:uncharacterized protein Dana_GF27778 [Drosophila ananassae]|uniref:Kazal-like domain-containing protein n=1 Tax=Drosophila ananassae TaxID=7217 RepID=A0A0N8P0Q5_DROAN|nr:uncharacterized protein Dana_GF27778 [Drosophila ananassae]